MAQSFVARHVRAKRPRTAQEVERILQHDVLPVWRGRRLSTITKTDTRQLLDPLVDRAPVLANRVLSILKTFGRWAIERDLIERSPFEGVRQPAEE
ncbi:phage integrase central domain-containing protein, partial [Roseiarcus sp.]|uniref:phage integrase central domain-containing protein n=1 Tax=Roseiarcus sp. TaxID=1969460 RepID=UPI003F9DEF92